jgi:hypothetical protein
MLRSLVLIITLTLSLFSYAQETNIVSREQEVELLHDLALTLLSKTNLQLNNISRDSLFEKALQKYFKLSIEVKEDQAMVETVIANIKKISDNVSSAKYKVHNEESSWCILNKLAVVPPPKKVIHLCPAFFELTETQKTATIIHEWFHLWGRGKINYIFEKYCFESKDLNSKELIRNADQYMFLMFFLGTNGASLRCF